MHCDLLIVGGEGDLAMRKLYPALYHLDHSGCLPDCLRIVAMVRREPSLEAFTARVGEGLGAGIDASTWARFASRLRTYDGDATSADNLGGLSGQHFSDQQRDLIVYLATPPAIFSPVCQALGTAGLIRANTRIVVEKPLGEDRASFRQINLELLSLFAEQQIYRIDHYLGKETVQNLLAIRFANALFEPLWNSNYIDHVQITVAETVGVGTRWKFYDAAGALRDMVQNHMLQLLCLVAMEPPAALQPDTVHDEKLKVLRSLAPIGADKVFKQTVRGQYREGVSDGQTSAGYLDEGGADNSSNTETFVAIKAYIDNWRWAGVPFYLRTGKRLPKRYSEIIVHFRDIPHAIFPRTPGVNLPNRLVIRLQPDEGIHLYLMSKVPGLDTDGVIQPVKLNLSFSEAFQARRVPDAYERLLLDALQANPTLFVRASELDAAWVWIDHMRAGWQATRQPVVPYPAGSWGPPEGIALIARDDRAWH